MKPEGPRGTEWQNAEDRNGGRTEREPVLIIQAPRPKVIRIRDAVLDEVAPPFDFYTRLQQPMGRPRNLTRLTGLSTAACSGNVRRKLYATALTEVELYSLKRGAKTIGWGKETRRNTLSWVLIK